jgi:hypothetical protein
VARLNRDLLAVVVALLPRHRDHSSAMNNQEAFHRHYWAGQSVAVALMHYILPPYSAWNPMRPLLLAAPPLNPPAAMASLLRLVELPLHYPTMMMPPSLAEKHHLD